MPKNPSKSSSKPKLAANSTPKPKSAPDPAPRPKSAAKKSPKEKPARIRLHRSFRRSYREDYLRPTETPGLLAHAVHAFQLIFHNFKLFLPLILIMVGLNIILVGLMNEDTFVQFQQSLDETTSDLQNGNLGTFARAGLLLVSTITTGGLSQGASESQQVFAVLLALITWLVTIYLLRHLLAGQKVKLRDGLYNALAPFISTLLIALVIFLEAIPVMIVVITYSAAVRTDFLSAPFYAFIYFIFAILLILLSIYLISSSLVALIAVSAPGLYPLKAMRTASDLLAGRRIKFIIRIIYLAIEMIVIWVIIMLPLIALDLWLKSVFSWLAGIPFVSLELLIMTCFTIVYATTYIYLYYRELLDLDDETERRKIHE